jgi:nickel-dependent lactate racemase
LTTQRTVFHVPYGKKVIQFELPSGMRGTLINSRVVPPLRKLDRAISEALTHPVHSAPLKDLAQSARSVCIVFTDITRACPDDTLVPALLRELHSAGVRRDRITLLCGIGMHRPSTFEEKNIKLGKEVVKDYLVVDHEPRNSRALVDLGMSENGTPFSVNRRAYESDLLVATGIVEPHQYAGYSGGGKTLAIGAGGEPLIAYTHGPKMVDHPGTRLGRIKGNPFQDAVKEVARRAGLRFIINVVQDEGSRPVALLAGDPEPTFEKLVSSARELYEVPIRRQVDVAVAGVGYPKDLNLYQATRAVSYLFFAPTPAVKDGGVFILPAPTPEGAGQGLGEQRFLETMRNASDMTSLLAELRKTGYPPGAQRAFVMAKVLEKTHVIVVGSETPEIVGQLKMIPAATMDQAFQIAKDTVGRKDLDVLVVPHALLTLPVVGDQKNGRED